MRIWKSLFGRPNPNAFFEQFDARANGACIEEGVWRKLEDYLLVRFRAVPDRDYRYDLEVGTGSVHSWTFRVEAGWRVVCKPDSSKKTLDFEIQISPKLVLVLEFPAHGSLETAAEFRRVLARLLYQTRHQTASDHVPPAELDSIVEFSEKDLTPVATSENAQRTLDRLEKKGNCEFAVPGKFCRLTALGKGTEASAKVLSADAVLAVQSRPDFNFELEVFDETGDRTARARLDRSLTYHFDYQAAMFLWTERGADAAEACFAFSVGVDDLRTLENLFLQFFTETENKVSFEQFLGSNKDDWAQFYQRRAPVPDPPELARFRADDDHLRYNFESPLVDVSSSVRKSAREGPNRSLMQARTSGRIMTARGTAVDVYTFDEEQRDLDFLGQFPFAAGKEEASPGKVVLLDRHNRLAWLDTSRPDAVQLSDLGKGQVVRTFVLEKGSKVVDFSTFGGKSGQEAGNDLLLGLGERSLALLDPRDPTGTVQQKTYKGDMGFERILGVRDGDFAVSSQDGSIRLFDNLNTQARNLIPAYLRDKVVSLDASKDGLFLLANCGRYLLLFLTQADGVNGYRTTFKKDAKPAPRILKVHPTAVAALDLGQLSFAAARFDEHRESPEKFVIAWNDHAYAVWSLTRVMRNDCSTGVVRRFRDRVVGAQFRIDAADILTAFDDKLAFQKTGLPKPESR